MILILCCCLCELPSAPVFLGGQYFTTPPPLHLCCSSAKFLVPTPPPICRHNHYAPRRHSAVLPSAAPEGACGCPLALGGGAVAGAGAACALHSLLAAGTHRLLAWPGTVCGATPRFGVCALRHPHAAPGVALAIGPSHGGLCRSGSDGSVAIGVHRPDSPWSGRQLGRGSCGPTGPVCICAVCGSACSASAHAFCGRCLGGGASRRPHLGPDPCPPAPCVLWDAAALVG